MTENNLNIRIANINDLDKVAPLFDAYRVFYGRESDMESSRAFLKDRYKNEEVITFLAEDQHGTPVGFSNIFHSFSSVSAAPIWVLNDLFVDPDFRRQGIAESLMQSIEEEATTQGVVRVKLETATDNAPAQACYVKRGWEQSPFLTFSIPIDQKPSPAARPEPPLENGL